MNTRINPTIQPFTITTEGTLEDMAMTRASIPDMQVFLLLSRPPGVVYAYNQDRVLVELSLDMDTESIVATAVQLRDGVAHEVFAPASGG